jgi:hypothetical protein
MILAGPHDRLPSWPTAAPAQSAGFPPLFHFPACTSGILAAIVTQRTHNAGEQAIVRHARPPRKPKCSAELPEIDTGRTLIARSSTGSVGPGERIGQRGGAGEYQQTLAGRAQQNTCSVRYGRPCRMTGIGAHSTSPRISSSERF